MTARNAFESLSTEAKQDAIITALASAVAKLSSDPATQATLAAVLGALQDTLAVTATSLPLPDGAATDIGLVSIASILAGTLTTDGSGHVQPVSGTVTANVSGTVPVSGTFWPATQPVSIAGSVAVSGPLTDVQLRAAPVPVSGTVTANISGTVPVSGTFWQATQPVSLAALPALAAGTAVIGKVAGSNGGALATDTSDRLLVVGNVGSASADSGNPVKIGGVVASTLPTLTNGQRSDILVDARGHIQVLPKMGQFTGSDALSNGALGSFPFSTQGGTTGSGALMVVGTYVFNGASWDRVKKPNSADRIISSAATPNPKSAKASAGDLFKITGTNTAAAKRYLKLYNKASAPTVGTDVPVITLSLPAAAPFDFTFPAPVYFSAGIAYAITGAAADTDTTAIAVGDIECLNVIYQ